MEYPGNLFVVAAPSGAGKSSLVKALLELDAKLSVSISHTSRAPRGQEQHGREYWFVDEAARDQARNPVSAANYEAARIEQGALRDVLELLALPYADRPGYREDWRP